MEQRNTDNLIRRQPGVIVLSTSNVAFAILCAYLAMISLCYIGWMPGGLVSLSLYGFVGLMGLSLLVSGRVSFGLHTGWYAVFVGICAISCLYASYPTVASAQMSDLLKLLIFSLMFINVMDSQKRIQTAMLVITVSITVLFIYLFSTGQLIVDERLGQSLTGNANIFAMLFMVGAFSSVYFVYFSEKKFTKVLAIVCFLMQLYALALSGSRKFFLLPVALLACMKVFSTDRAGRKHVIRNMAIAAVVVIVALWAIYNVEVLYDSIGYRMEGLFAAFTGEGEVDASTEIRQNLIAKGIELWKNKPILGYGIDNYKLTSGYGAYAHNNYAELLADLGLVGTLVYYWFFVRLVWKLALAKWMGMQRWYWAIMLGCLMVFDYGAVSYDMYPVQILLLLANSALQQKDTSAAAPEGKEVTPNE